MSGTTGLYRHQTKTPGSYTIGFDFDLDTGRFYEALRAPKRENSFYDFRFWVILGPFGTPHGVNTALGLGAPSFGIYSGIMVRVTPMLELWTACTRTL